MNHQQHQRVVINKIADQVERDALQFSTVSPTTNYDSDPRLCLTSVHIPHQHLINQIQQQLITPLRQIEPNFYYYPPDSLHMTIKSVRAVNHPPHFDEQDIKQAQQIFTRIITRHRKFEVYFERLLLFPHNLALIGTTNPELDKIILDLNQALNSADIPDDKTYANEKYFFSNVTLVRFNTSPLAEFRKEVESLSDSLKFEPYQVDSATLLTCNAVFKQRDIKGSWSLQ